MNSPYEDIIYLPHHVSSTRKRMSMVERAAQFSPFAALNGYDAAIRETGRLTEQYIDLDVDGKSMLNEKIRILAEYQDACPDVTVTYFVPDERKQGGAYVRKKGRVKKIDQPAQRIILEDDTRISFGHIYDLTIDTETAWEDKMLGS